MSEVSHPASQTKDPRLVRNLISQFLCGAGWCLFIHLNISGKFIQFLEVEKLRLFLRSPAPPGSPLIRVYFIKSSEAIGVGYWGLQFHPFKQIGGKRQEPGTYWPQLPRMGRQRHAHGAPPRLTTPSIWNGTLQRQTLNTNSDAHTSPAQPSLWEHNTPPATLFKC